jgi:hypothetical protein
VRALLAMLAAGCTVGGGAGIDIPSSLFGVVYECTDEAGSVVELCYNQDRSDIEDDLEVSCEPTSRHSGPCWYHCDGGAGCNATGGCYCPG